MIKYSYILEREYAGSEWTMHGEDYDSLQWHSETVKPSKEDLDALWPLVEQAMAEEAAALVANRQAGLEKIAALGLTAEEISAIFGL